MNQLWTFSSLTGTELASMQVGGSRTMAAAQWQSRSITGIQQCDRLPTCAVGQPRRTAPVPLAERPQAAHA